MKPNELIPEKNIPSIWPSLAPKTCTLYQTQTLIGTPISFWKANPAPDNTLKKQSKQGFDSQYACHGATIGSDQWDHGPFTPYGDSIDIILKEYFTPVKQKDLKQHLIDIST